MPVHLLGSPGISHVRSGEKRYSLSLQPPGITILDAVKDAGMEVMGVGKIEDIFDHRGLTLSNHTVGNNMAGIDAIIQFLNTENTGLIFANLVDFDALYGHRNNPRRLRGMRWKLLIVDCLK